MVSVYIDMVICAYNFLWVTMFCSSADYFQGKEIAPFNIMRQTVFVLRTIKLKLIIHLFYHLFIHLILERSCEDKATWVACNILYDL